MTPLAAKIIARIRADGPMTIAEYMADCLGNPDYGYYLNREPFGGEGDFITAPEISQMFGELVGLWAVATWEAMGAPAQFILAETGPGRGTLIADMLRAARIRPEFGAARVCLIETSPRLRAVQEKTLAASGADIRWHEDIGGIPAGPMVLIANEFFDALPIRQFVRTSEGWAERMVGIGEDGRLAFGLRPVEYPSQASLPTAAQSERRYLPRKGGEGASLEASTSPSALVGKGRGERSPPEGGIIELSDASTAIMSNIAARLAGDGGAALVIDYGYVGPAFGDTLQAVRNHRYDDPLAAPGETDLTAHVDFGALARAARDAGGMPRAVMGQGEFLMRMGLGARVEALSKGKDAAARAGIVAAAERLAGPDAMGTLFKVLAVSSPGLVLPTFDDNPAGETAKKEIR